MKILAPIPYYLPGFKAGGPVSSTAAIVSSFGDEFQFKIITPDRYPRKEKPYPNVKPDSWQKVGKADVFYLSPGLLSLLRFARVIRDTEHDVIYLTSFFAVNFTLKILLLRRLGLIKRRPVIVVPRGELAEEALSIKHAKKRVYLTMAKILRLYSGVVWQASNVWEKNDISLIFPDAVVHVCPNIVTNEALPDHTPNKSTGGPLKVIFLSRISRKKNLSGALLTLSGLHENVVFDIYGPLEDEKYWQECQKLIRKLPPNIKASYRGILGRETVTPTLKRYDVLFLPTLNENFGHVIFEALISGCPVLIGEKTPWRDVRDRGAGYAFPADDVERFRSALRDFAAMDAGARKRMSDCAREYGLRYLNNPAHVDAMRRLFIAAAS